MRAEDALGTSYQSHISPSILVYAEDGEPCLTQADQTTQRASNEFLKYLESNQQTESNFPFATCSYSPLLFLYKLQISCVSCIQFPLCNLPHGFGNAPACQDTPPGMGPNINLTSAILPGAIFLLIHRGDVCPHEIQVTFQGYLQKVLAEVRIAAARCIPPRTASPPLGMHLTPTPPWLRLVPCQTD